MAFFEGTGSKPPLWFVKLRLAREWGCLPTELGSVPALWVHRQMLAWNLEAEARKNA